MTTTTHEILTQSMIQALRDDADKHGDAAMAELCREALSSAIGPRTDQAKQAVADAYNRARAADYETPYVEVRIAPSALAPEPAPDFTWQPSDEEHYDDALNALWPACNMSRTDMFLLGEPMDHDESGRARFTPYLHDADGYWVGSRPVTRTEFRTLARRQK